MVTFGILVASCINTIIMKSPIKDQTEWRLAFSVQAIPGVLLFLIVFFLLPETPRFLASIGQYQQAHLVLSKLRGESLEQVEIEFNEIKCEVERDAVMGKSKWIELIQKPLRLRILIIMCLQMFQQLTGINAIMCKLFPCLSIRISIFCSPNGVRQKSLFSQSYLGIKQCRLYWCSSTRYGI